MSNKKRISDINNSKEFSYTHMIMEKQNQFNGESVEEFLRRGGEIKKVGVPLELKRDEKGRYIKNMRD